MSKPFHEIIAEYQGRIMNYSVAMMAMDGSEFTHKERQQCSLRGRLKLLSSQHFALVWLCILS